MPRRYGKGRRRTGSSPASRRRNTQATGRARQQAKLPTRRRTRETPVRKKFTDWSSAFARIEKLEIPRNNVPRRLLDRRASVSTRTPRATKFRLPTTPVPPPRRDEEPNKSKATPCAGKKQERRSVILATGHGGRNRVKDYDKWRKCK